MAKTKKCDMQSDSGQAAVESAITLPLLVFLVLGTLQLFMLLQGRILAQHAAYRAVRAGSLNHGDCLPMTHSAILAVLPSIDRTDTPDKLVESFAARRDNLHNMQGPGGQVAFAGGPVIEIVRERPDPFEWDGAEALRFDDPSSSESRLRLELRMVYWFYMRVPFANRVISDMLLAHLGIREYQGFNPLMPTQNNARWRAVSTAGYGGNWPGGDLRDRMLQWSQSGHYLFPIQVNAAMRMMTPARREHFRGGGACPVP